MIGFYNKAKANNKASSSGGYRGLFPTFLRDNSAVAFVEFAIVAPVLISLMLGGFDLVLFSNKSASVENISANISKMFGYLSSKHSVLLSEIALSPAASPVGWVTPGGGSAVLQDYLSSSFDNYLSGLVFPFSLAAIGAPCGSDNDCIGIHVTIFECVSDVYQQKQFFLSGTTPSDPDHATEFSNIRTGIVPPSSCDSYENKKYIRTISFSVFNSPFTSLLEDQLDHVTISVIDNGAPIAR